MATSNDSKAPKEPYYLSRSRQASLRLTSQHYNATALLGWLLHPSIYEDKIANRQPDGDTLAVVDVACGNGAWLLDVHSHLTSLNEFSPSSPPQQFTRTLNLVGVDLSPIMFPPQSTLPSNSNLTFTTQDIFNPPSPNHTHTFDILNIRLIISAISSPSQIPTTILPNLTSHLAPHSWLQWTEFDPSRLIAHHPDPRVRARLRKLFIALWWPLARLPVPSDAEIEAAAHPIDADDQNNTDTDQGLPDFGGWIHLLASIFRDSGLFEPDSISTTVAHIPKERYGLMAENQAGAAADALEVLRGQASEGGGERTAGAAGAGKEMAEMVKRQTGYFEELERLRIEQGALVFIPFVVVVGRTKG